MSVKSFNLTIKTILVSAFFLNLAGFAVMSFLAVYLSNILAFTAVQTGTVLSFLLIFSKGLPLVTGALADKYGYKLMMEIGLIIRGGGMGILAFSQSFPVISIGAILIGIGAAFYEPSSRGFFSIATIGNERKKAFTYLNLSLNGGAIVGPLLGGLLLLFNPQYPFLISAVIFFIMYFVQLFIIPPQNQMAMKHISSLEVFTSILKNKRFIIYCSSMVFFWFMYAQLTGSLPLHMYNLSNSESLVTTVITVNALTGLLFMILFRDLFIRVETFKLLKSGIMIMSIALFMISFFPSSYWLLLCVVFFTVGETLVLPSSDIAISEFTNGKFQGAYFGFFELSFAIGATFGSYAGTVLLSHYPNSPLPWLIYLGAGMFGYLLLITVIHLPQQNYSH
ncbi:MFS transporter [Bacillus solimangrovi]|uniref:Major facilitator superfamily (MFS) profile domain-containing protein n=1 Tax=Bacillus solimangrovi TaxID=1305675 RepID=A0A1E5LIF3_9BACI|nr:MFS transporter [Bacillus solimangrovi]OEH93862.1 hypothetical protein BFG57_11115 [Bacillus solimangrovi]